MYCGLLGGSPLSNVVVNADDFGLSVSVTDGILEGIDAGVVTDVSLMANGQAFEYAVSELNKRGIRAVGVHLCVVDGERPISPPGEIAALLVGDFFPMSARPFKLFLNVLFRRGSTAKALRIEFMRQIETIQSAGLEISHLDSHQHVHLFPVISRIAVECCRRYGIRFVRVPVSSDWRPVALALRFLGYRLRVLISRAGLTPVDAIGYDSTGANTVATLSNHLEHLSKIEMGELVVHPGFSDDSTRSRYAHWRCTDWEGELNALKACKLKLTQGIIQLTTYAKAGGAEMISCPLCGTDSVSVKFVLGRHRVVRCDACSLLYNMDFLASGSAEEVFSAQYYRDVQRAGFAHIWDKKVADPSAKIYQAGLNAAEAALGGAGRVLDVGCAFGAFLGLAKFRGWNVQGVELSPYSSEIAREQRGFDVFSGSLLDATFDNQSFDLITFWDVLEHTTNAFQQLRRASDLLRPGGILLLTTDNYKSLISMLGVFIYMVTAGKLTYPMERFFLPYNSCYFTRADFTETLKGLGLKIILDKGIDHPIDRINLNVKERLMLRALYRAGDILNLNSQFMLLAQKVV